MAEQASYRIKRPVEQCPSMKHLAKTCPTWETCLQEGKWGDKEMPCFLVFGLTDAGKTLLFSIDLTEGLAARHRKMMLGEGNLGGIVIIKAWVERSLLNHAFVAEYLGEGGWP